MRPATQLKLRLAHQCGWNCCTATRRPLPARTSRQPILQSKDCSRRLQFVSQRQSQSHVPHHALRSSVRNNIKGPSFMAWRFLGETHWIHPFELSSFIYDTIRHVDQCHLKLLVLWRTSLPRTLTPHGSYIILYNIPYTRFLSVYMHYIKFILYTIINIYIHVYHYVDVLRCILFDLRYTHIASVIHLPHNLMHVVSIVCESTYSSPYQYIIIYIYI